MAKSWRIPVLFFAFTNSENREYLSLLKKESEEIREMFHPLDESRKFKILIIERLGERDIPNQLDAFEGRILLFHYSGHASQNAIALEDGDVFAMGLARLLRFQKNTKLVFLNGCGTYKQALTFLKEGIPLVVATTDKVTDKAASIFSIAFYKALIKNYCIEDAFNKANGVLNTIIGANSLPDTNITYVKRDIGFEGNGYKNLNQWQLFVLEGEERLLKWKLNRKKPYVLPFISAIFAIVLLLLFYFILFDIDNKQPQVNPQGDNRVISDTLSKPVQDSSKYINAKQNKHPEPDNGKPNQPANSNDKKSTKGDTVKIVSDIQIQDRDGDKVPDLIDKCINIEGLKELYGCPPLKVSMPLPSELNGSRIIFEYKLKDSNELFKIDSTFYKSVEFLIPRGIITESGMISVKLYNERLGIDTRYESRTLENYSVDLGYFKKYIKK